MKLYVHYTVWNKAAHVPWLCEGIKYLPKDTVIDFVFDNCTDNSLQNFVDHGINGTLKEFKDIRYFESTKKLRAPNTNDAIERFMASDCDLFLTPQDDQKVQDKHIHRNLARLYAQEPNVGLVGMRDGIIHNTQIEYFSCSHSHAVKENVTWLEGGQYKEVHFVNDGPLCFSKATIEKVGLLDTEYWAHYIDNDYCKRCNDHGFRNFVMGAEIIHEKWGCRVCGPVIGSEVWTQEYSSHDWEVYQRKCGSWKHLPF